MYEAKMTRPKSEFRHFGALLGRVFHALYLVSKSMLIATNGFIHLK